jgi:hypothetical protein
VLNALHQVGDEASNLVAEALGGDDSNLIGNLLVGLEVQSEARVVLLDELASGPLDGLGSDTTLLKRKEIGNPHRVSWQNPERIYFRFTASLWASIAALVWQKRLGTKSFTTSGSQQGYSNNGDLASRMHTANSVAESSRNRTRGSGTLGEQHRASHSKDKGLACMRSFCLPSSSQFRGSSNRNQDIADSRQTTLSASVKKSTKFKEPPNHNDWQLSRNTYHGFRLY